MVNKPKKQTSATQALANRVRIIGGRWRGRRISFPPVASLRPSPDRVRETLFNWLQPVIAEARCLDLFAGSGALGIEALSRGARSGVFVERDARVVRYLQETLRELGATDFTVIGAEAMQFLRGTPQLFDVVFLDPPYAYNELGEICRRLASGGWLAPRASVYLECGADAPLPELPPGWIVHRAKRAGQVGYHLLQASADERSP